MTDRVNALTVILHREMRDDEAEALCGAIRQFRAVLEVRLGDVQGIEHIVAREQVRNELVEKLYGVLRRTEP